MRALTALCLAAALAAPAALAAQQPAAQPGTRVWDRVVAVVGDTSVLYSDVLLEIESMQAQGQQVPTDPTARRQMERDVLQRRVDDLLLLEAARRDKLTVDAAEIAGQVETQINRVQQNFGSQAAMEQALAQTGRTLEQYRATLTQQYTDQTMIQRYIRERLSKMAAPPVTDAEIQQYFEQQRGSLGQRPATLSFQQAVVKPVAGDSADATARRKAEAILAELRRGGDFEAIARRDSQDPSAPQGGMLGWFHAGQMVREFEQMAFALRPGDISPVVKTEFGYHIIKLEKVRGGERQARHILIRPEITEADVARARTLADSIATAARGGASLTQLAARTTTPPDQRTLRDVLPDRLPPEYGQAIGDAAPGTVVGPFQLGDPSGPSFVVAKVTDRRTGGEYTLADVREQIRDRIIQQRQVDRLLGELRQVTAVTVMQ
ncbi:peptidylprolyl isomerase [Longimicrobium sp.]|uniref:peptidylprolyl isomerase n=1 Tax=Longimicrobium sp. TaxID=2029185 RepID=UPI002B71C7B3|nr:peptidylprolyl isomerase [Longimicrobium sp.]HSU16233.1 peptidylprolyl isomerase [Longimicrobium sp.]